jgi:hypothetical protein
MNRFDLNLACTSEPGADKASAITLPRGVVSKPTRTQAHEAALCREAGMTTVVEPEVRMDSDRTLIRRFKATEHPRHPRIGQNSLKY